MDQNPTVLGLNPLLVGLIGKILICLVIRAVRARDQDRKRTTTWYPTSMEERMKNQSDSLGQNQKGTHSQNLGRFQDYRGFRFRMTDDGEVELWAETTEAQDVWRNVDSSAELYKGSHYIFCGYWRPPTMEGLRTAIDALWDKHGPTRD